MESISRSLRYILKQILSVISAFYLLFGIKMDFSFASAKKNFKERKELFKRTATQVALVMFFLLIVFFHFYIPGVSLLTATAISFLFTALGYLLATAPVLIVESFFLNPRFSAFPYSSSRLISNTTFKPVFIPVPTSPPRFNLAA